ncbi:MAG: restriction endonuclease subunit S [Algoriphagus sp.]|nr:restriction endonuclease subunit S [Algoriphagus sp.]
MRNKDTWPERWELTTLDDVTERITNGINLPQLDLEIEKSFPISRIETIANESIDFNRVKYVVIDEDVLKKYSLQEGDILFSHINSDKHLGKTAIYNGERILIHGVNLLLIRANSKIDKKLFNYLFRHYRFQGKFIDVAQRSVNQSSINQKKLKEFTVPLISAEEQQRIVAKLDALFGHFDVLREKLDRIPVLLKNFRQQVLTQAVTGELTREWREGGGLPKQKAKEIRNKDYSLDDIPNEWVHTIIGTIASVKGGKRLPKEEALTEEITNHPYIRARDLKKGTVLTENLLYITEDVYEKISRYIVNEGDVYITIVGAKIGDAGIIPESMDGANLTENAAKLTEMQYVIPTYLSIWLRSPICQAFIQKTIMSAAQGKLALTRIKSLPIYLPHLVEQEKIVSTVESLFSLADKIESQYQSLKAKIDQLPQATLAKAFLGELVEQEVKEYVREAGEVLMTAGEMNCKIEKFDK